MQTMITDPIGQNADSDDRSRFVECSSKHSIPAAQNADSDMSGQNIDSDL